MTGKPYSELETTDPASVVKASGSDIAIVGILALVIFAIIGFLTTCAGVMYGLYKLYAHVFP
jgi:hypothetical protein